MKLPQLSLRELFPLLALVAGVATIAASQTIFSVALVCLGGCSFGSPSEHSRPVGHGDMSFDVSPVDDVIVFSATGAGGRDLYLLDLETLRVTRIAETPDYEVSPSLSADGKQVVYAAGVPSDRADHIFIRSVAGDPPEQLTHADCNDDRPRFSPDGSLIAFDRFKEYQWGGYAANWGGYPVVCVVGGDGQGEREAVAAEKQSAFAPQFSSDGKSIHYSTDSGRASLPVDDTSPPQAMPGRPGAALSPDGTLLAYIKGQFEPESKVYVSGSDGSSERLLTPERGACYHPVFSRGGERVFFLVGEWPNGAMGTPKCSLWEVAIDGGAPRMIADSGLFDDPLGWNAKKSVAGD